MTAILSRAILHLRSDPSRRWTAEYTTHQLVADLFGDRSDRGYLYRTVQERPGGVEVLVLSPDAPLGSESLPVRSWGAAVGVESKPFAPRLTAGQVVDFEIRINATRVITDPATGRKHRTDVWEAVWRGDPDTVLSPHEVYGEYLTRKLSGSADLIRQECDRATGAESLVRLTERTEVRARRGGRGSRGDRSECVRFVAANLIGTLRVRDPEQLLAITTGGIGRAKAFGCGLLCLSAPGTVLARRNAGNPSLRK